MDNAEVVSGQNHERRNTLFLPFLIALAGVVIMVILLFLPYMTAVGDMVEYIEKNPDRVENEALELTASDFANVSVISVNKIITGVYGENDGTIATVIVSVFGGFMALTVLFVILKKPIAVIVLTCWLAGYSSSLTT